MRIAFQMDAPESLDLAGDSSFALALEAARRGFALHWYGVESLTLEDWRLSAFVRPLRVKGGGDGDGAGAAMESGDGRRERLDTMDMILVRQNPPFNMNYLHATWLLEYLPPATLVLNDPRALRDAPEKLLRGEAAEHTPPTLISSDLELIEAFARRQPDGVVLKPLYGYGGYGVVRVTAEEAARGGALAAHLARLRESWEGPPLAQAYLPAVSREERRVFLIGGAAVGVIGRVPAAGEFRANLRLGARGEAAELRAHEVRVAGLVAEALGAERVLFAGLDFIGDYLTEVNVTSPTGLTQLRTLSGVDGASLFWDAALALRARRTA